MKHIKPLILESKQIGVLYHFTSMYNSIQILETMLLKASFIDKEDKNLNDFKYYVSFTRNPILYKTLNDKQKRDGGIRFEVRLKFSGDILSHKYRFKAYDDNFNNTQELIDKGFDMGDESEERLYTNNRYIDIKKSFINEVTVIFISQDFYEISLNQPKSKFNSIKNICLKNNYTLKVIIL